MLAIAAVCARFANLGNFFEKMVFYLSLYFALSPLYLIGAYLPLIIRHQNTIQNIG